MDSFYTISNCYWLAGVQMKRYLYIRGLAQQNRIQTVKLKIPGKAFLKSESRISVTFKFLTIAIYQWQLLELSKMNVTEVRDFKNSLPEFSISPSGSFVEQKFKSGLISKSVSSNVWFLSLWRWISEQNFRKWSSSTSSLKITSQIFEPILY